VVKSLWAKQEVKPLVTEVEAENVADLRINRWLVLARRPVEPVHSWDREWHYVAGIRDDMPLFKRVRELQMMTMVQRRDGDTWTLLGKVSQAKADEWNRTIEREVRGPR
jgi:hypothetical protein